MNDPDRVAQTVAQCSTALWACSGLATWLVQNDKLVSIIGMCIGLLISAASLVAMVYFKHRAEKRGLMELAQIRDELCRLRAE